MRHLFPFIIILSLAMILISCGSGGRTVTVGGVSVTYNECAGEFDSAMFDSLTAGVTAGRKDTVTATFEYSPDAAGVTYYTADGTSGELAYSINGYTLSFSTPDDPGEYSFKIEYTIDGTLYNLAFKLNIE